MHLKNINHQALKRLQKKSLKKLTYKAFMLTTITSFLLFSNDNPPLKTKVISVSTTSSFDRIETELNNLSDDKIYNFTNNKVKEEILKILNKTMDEPITYGELKKITSLELTDQVTSDALTDVKYLTNLKILTLSKCNVDCSDLEHNQKLEEITIAYSNITNNDKLPNPLKKISLINSTCKEEVFNLPYHTKELNVLYSYINNLSLKNPLSLTKLVYNSSSVLDLNILEKCSNLESLDLSSSLNIKNVSKLLDYFQIKKITLDDYAPIWLNEDTYIKLISSKKVSVPYDLTSECYYLDKVTEEIQKRHSNIQNQIDEAINYIVSTFFYNEELSMQEELTTSQHQMLTNYNTYPIKTSFSKSGIICINYASLYQALLNRLNIECYTLQSINHAWNLYDNNNDLEQIDLTNIDQVPLIYDEKSKQTSLLDMTGAVNLINFGTDTNTTNQIYQPLNYPIILKKIAPSELGYLTKNNNYLYEILYNNRKYILTPLALILLIQALNEIKKNYQITKKERKLQEKEQKLTNEIIKTIKEISLK